MLRWNDFVILCESLFWLTLFTTGRGVEVRFNALSRAIEAALQKEGVPNRVLAGHKFFERLEVRLGPFGGRGDVY